MAGIARNCMSTCILQHSYPYMLRKFSTVNNSILRLSSYSKIRILNNGTSEMDNVGIRNSNDATNQCTRQFSTQNNSNLLMSSSDKITPENDVADHNAEGSDISDRSADAATRILSIAQVTSSMESGHCNNELPINCDISNSVNSSTADVIAKKIASEVFNVSKKDVSSALKRRTTYCDTTSYIATPSLTTKTIIVRSRKDLKTSPTSNFDGNHIKSIKSTMSLNNSSEDVKVGESQSANDVIRELLLPDEKELKHSIQKKLLKPSSAVDEKVKVEHERIESDPETRTNPIGIQMLPKNLYDQVFKYSSSSDIFDNNISSTCQTDNEASPAIHRSIEHLKQQKLWGKTNTRQENVHLQLPELFGNSVEEHFRTIADEQCAPYKKLLHEMTHNPLPHVPTDFVFREGWTKYHSDGSSSSVRVPDCRAFVFDVEVCVTEGSQPTLAAAVSSTNWYTWCSTRLVGDASMVSNANSTTGEDFITDSYVTTPTVGLENDVASEINSNKNISKKYNEMQLNNLIPFSEESGSESNQEMVPKIIVGHNVSYDRIRIREQYYVPDCGTRFIDTMSLHIAVSGLVQEQRAMVMKNSAAVKKIHLPWMSVGSLNSLKDVYKLYCNSEGLKKETRNIFVTGSMEEIRQDFQNLMAYCAMDVQATHKVLVNLLPQFYERLSHPVTLAGIMEMGSSYLPINDNWEKYLDSSEQQFEIMQSALTEKLSQRAVEALTLLKNNQYRNDPWLWNLDWAIPSKIKKSGRTLPAWYVKLCKATGERKGSPEPGTMSTSLRVVPKLLRLTWKGLPLHHEKDYGWGCLRPTYSSYDAYCVAEQDENDNNGDGNYDSTGFPVQELYKISPKDSVPAFQNISDLPFDVCLDPDIEDWESLLYGGETSTIITANSKAHKRTLKNKSKSSDDTEQMPIDIGIPGVEFIRLPHKNGPKNNVGNPLAKDFLHKIEDGTLSSHIQEVAELVLRTTKMIAYWRNARDRIMSQSVVWLGKDNLPAHSTLHPEYSDTRKFGAILPQVVVCGTVTRRAVERTWLTASNARADRIGSELKSMITAPPGYHFVGADVDSQELWIAALLGDAYYTGVHGGTAMSWMTLQGNKADGTDLHSNTARTAHITRDQAKVINYGRLYGAGLRFLKMLLTQYNPDLSTDEAQKRAEVLLKATKGEKGWRLSEEGRALLQEHLNTAQHDPLTRRQILRALRELSRDHRVHATFDDFVTRPAVWLGGSESHTFNCLEAIVRQDRPTSPVLQAAIPRPLEPQYAANNHMTSRMNWVVQSSAVDYLHLMAVSMRWLAKKYDINMRFAISIHDEVRYLVSSEDRHRAALALQVTNLLTRALFAHRVNMPDLPLAVAFFSSVDIDKVLRKDPCDACVTPSNPDGLEAQYGIKPGDPLSIYQLIKHGVTLDKSVPDTSQ